MYLVPTDKSSPFFNILSKALIRLYLLNLDDYNSNDLCKVDFERVKEYDQAKAFVEFSFRNLNLQHLEIKFGNPVKYSRDLMLKNHRSILEETSWVTFARYISLYIIVGSSEESKESKESEESKESK